MASRKPFNIAIKKDKIKKTKRAHTLAYGEDAIVCALMFAPYQAIFLICIQVNTLFLFII